MAQIFISYARADKEFAAQLAHTLELMNYDVEWDEFIPAGVDFRAHLNKSLSKAECIVVCWSKASVMSRWVLEEAEEGYSRGVLIPVLCEAVEIPRGFRALQSIDLTQWDGERRSEKLETLTAALNDKLSEAKAGLLSRSSATTAQKFILRRKASKNVAVMGFATFCFIAFAGWDFFQADQGLNETRLRLLAVGTFVLLSAATWMIRQEPYLSWMMSVNVIAMSAASMIINHSFSNPELGLDKFASPLNIAAIFAWGIGVAAISFTAALFSIVATLAIYTLLLVYITDATPIFIVASTLNLLLVGVGLSLAKLN